MNGNRSPKTERRNPRPSGRGGSQERTFDRLALITDLEFDAVQEGLVCCRDRERHDASSSES